MTRNEKRRPSWVLLGLAAAVVLWGSWARAQTQPLAQQEQPAQQATYSGRTGTQGPAGIAPLSDYQVTYQNYAPWYPAPEVGAVPPAAAQAQALYWEYLRAEDELSRVVDSAVRRFAHSEPAMQTAAQEREAWSRYDEARQHALESLSQDPDYQSLVTLKQQLERRIAEARRERRPDMKKIQAMAMAKLTYATQATAREQAVLGGDQRVQQSKQQFVDAAAKKQDVRDRFQRELADSAQLAAARRRVEEMRTASLAADTYYAFVRDARNIALDYVEDAQNYSYYSPSSSYPPYYQNYPAWWLSERH